MVTNAVSNIWRQEESCRAVLSCNGCDKSEQRTDCEVFAGSIFLHLAHLHRLLRGAEICQQAGRNTAGSRGLKTGRSRTRSAGCFHPGHPACGQRCRPSLPPRRLGYQQPQCHRRRHHIPREYRYGCDSQGHREVVWAVPKGFSCISNAAHQRADKKSCHKTNRSHFLSFIRKPAI